MRWLAYLAILVAICLLGWAAYTYQLEACPVPPVEVESPERDLGERPVGKSQVVFRVSNPSNHHAEVISSPDGCGKMCCLKPMVTERQTIPPGGSVDVVCELLVAAPQEFEFSGNLYLNDNGLRSVKLTVRGVGVASRANDAPPKQ